MGGAGIVSPPHTTPRVWLMGTKEWGGINGLLWGWVWTMGLRALGLLWGFGVSCYGDPTSQLPVSPHFPPTPMGGPGVQQCWGLGYGTGYGASWGLGMDYGT